jgi:hypothetical protein
MPWNSPSDIPSDSFWNRKKRFSNGIKS